MKSVLLVVLLLSAPTLAKGSKSTTVEGYVKKDGTYVVPHSRTKPNKTQADNWSTKGNANPNTGKRGTKAATK